MTVEPNTERRASILQAAVGVFLRYGYKKTSMEDVARAAGLSRQGLYLHFAAKDVLFKDAVTLLTQQSRVATRAALALDHLPIEERLLGAFVALKSHSDGSELSPEHMAELLATAAQLAGPAIAQLDQAVLADLQRALLSSGVAARWKGAGLTARDLAQHLTSASHGIKHFTRTAAEYRERMRVAVCLVCGPASKQKRK